MRNDLKKRIVVVASALEKLSITSNDNALDLTIYDKAKKISNYLDYSNLENEKPLMSLLDVIVNQIRDLKTSAKNNFSKTRDKTQKPNIVKKVLEAIK